MTQMPLPGPIVHKTSWAPAKMRETLRSPIKCHGGKFYLSSHILPICEVAMNSCPVWGELYAGGANFSLQSELLRNAVQIVNDSDPLTANVWRCFADSGTALNLIDRLSQIKCGSHGEMLCEFQAAKQVVSMYASPEAIEKLTKTFFTWDKRFCIGLATAFIVNRRMSRGGLGEELAWSDRQRGGQPGDMNAWKTFVSIYAPLVAQRANGWLVFCQDALGILWKQINESNFFCYLDPPYLSKTRSVTQAYRREMSDREHESLIAMIREAKCKIAISGYESDLYRQNLTKDRGWTEHMFAVVNNSGQNKKKQNRIEWVWTNF